MKNISKLNTMKPILTFLFFLNLLSVNAQDKWPTQAWTKTSPEKLNLNPDSLAAVDRDFAAGIEARLHHKDFGLVLEAARKSGVPVPLTANAPVSTRFSW